MTKEEFMNAVVDYCRQTNGSVSSWGRTRSHNTKVGGVPTSWHLSWRAADVVYDAVLDQQMKVDMAALKGRLTIYDLTEQDCVMWFKGRATERMNWLAQSCEAHAAQCVIVDNASDTFADNENVHFLPP